MRVKTLLTLGVAIRELFSFWTGHPFDFEVWVRVGYWVAKDYNPYAPVPFAPGVSFANDFAPPGTLGSHAAIGYLPFWPVLLAAIYKLYSFVGFGNRFVYYFMLKQPIIFADVLVGFLLYLYVEKHDAALAPKVLALWLFSPITIIVGAIWGTFDSMAMVGVMLALLAPAGRGRSIWDGIATFVKSIPILFILPLSWSREKWWENLLIAVGIPVIASLLVILVAGWPIYGQEYTVVGTLGNTLHVYGFPLSLWGTWVYLNMLGFISDATFMTVFNLGGGFFWIPAVIAASLLARRWFGFETDQGIIQSLLLIYLTFLLVRGQVNEQYSIYLLALILLDAAIWSPRRMKLFYAVSIVVVAAILTNNVLLIRFLTPVYPNALQVEANLISATGSLRNNLLYVEGLAFSGLNLWYLAALINERRPRGNSP